jgi:hypothetical protein
VVSSDGSRHRNGLSGLKIAGIDRTRDLNLIAILKIGDRRHAIGLDNLHP